MTDADKRWVLEEIALATRVAVEIGQPPLENADEWLDLLRNHLDSEPDPDSERRQQLCRVLADPELRDMLLQLEDDFIFG